MLIKLNNLELNVFDNRITIRSMPDITLRILYPYTNLFASLYHTELFISFNISQYTCYVSWNYFDNTSKHIIVNSDTIIDNYGNVYNHACRFDNLLFFSIGLNKLLLKYSEHEIELDLNKNILFEHIVTCCSDYYNINSLPNELLLKIFTKVHLNPIFLFANFPIMPKILPRIVTISSLNQEHDLDLNSGKWLDMYPIEKLYIVDSHIVGTVICPSTSHVIVIKDSFISDIDLRLTTNNLNLELNKVVYYALWANNNIVSLKHVNSTPCHLYEYNFNQLKELEINEDISASNEDFILFNRIIFRQISSLDKLKIRTIRPHLKFHFPIKKLEIEELEQKQGIDLDKLCDIYPNIQTLNCKHLVFRDYGKQIVQVDARLIVNLDLLFKNIFQLKINISQLYRIKLPLNLKILYIENDSPEKSYLIKKKFPYTLQKIYYKNFDNFVTTSENIICLPINS